MDEIVTPSARELEYLVRVIERAVTVRTRPGLSAWSQGLLQTLLPHQVMVCLRFDVHGDPREMLCLHNDMAHTPLEDSFCALAVRLTVVCRRQYRLPCVVDGHGAGALAEPWREAAALVPGAVLLHGSGELRCGMTMFALFGMPAEGTARHKYFAELLLPCLHLAWRRQAAYPLPDQATAPRASPIEHPLTQRELDILRKMQEGKINADIGLALGISAHTVKKHIFNIYRKLAVENRVQAVSRAAALTLIGQAA